MKHTGMEASCREGSKISMNARARLKAKPQFGRDDVLGTWLHSLEYLARVAFRW
jgi:hypothetical protein